MKRIYQTLFLFIFYLSANGQTFFVEKTDEGFEQPIIDKLINLNKRVVFKEDKADYSIRCIISKTGMGRAKGSIVLIDNETDELIFKSKEANGQTSAFNGYANPKMITMKKNAESEVEYILSKINKR